MQRPDFGTLVKGYDGAHERYLAARAAGDAQRFDIALFETLNWIITLDDLISTCMKEKQNWYTTVERRPGQGLVVPGYRFIRNRVHHQWAQAVRLDGHTPPFQDWCWREIPELPEADPKFRNQRLEDAYARWLAGRALRHTFRDLHVLFNRAFAVLQVEGLPSAPPEAPAEDTGNSSTSVPV